MKKFLSVLLSGIMVLGLAGCSSGDKSDNGATKEVTTSELVSDVKGKVEMRSTAPIDDELAKSQYHLNLDEVDEYTIENGMINSGLEALAVVKAKEGKTEGVKKSLEQVMEDKKSAAFYPGESEAVAGAKLEVIGNYVVLFIIPNYDKTGTDFSQQAVDIVSEALK